MKRSATRRRAAEFGRPIARFQLVKKIADIATAVGLLRSYAWSLAGNLQAEPTRLAAAIGKYAAADLVLRAAQDAMQLHGGYGYTPAVPGRADVAGCPAAVDWRRHLGDPEAGHRRGAHAPGPRAGAFECLT